MWYFKIIKNKPMKNIKDIIQPLAILTFAFVMTVLVVGMIAYTNCPEAKLFIDNLMGKPMVVNSLPQA